MQSKNDELSMSVDAHTPKNDKMKRTPKRPPNAPTKKKSTPQKLIPVTKEHNKATFKKFLHAKGITYRMLHTKG